MEERPDRREVPSSADGWGEYCRPRVGPVLRLQGRRVPGFDANQRDQGGSKGKTRSGEDVRGALGIEIRAGYGGEVKDHGFLSESGGILRGTWVIAEYLNFIKH